MNVASTLKGFSRLRIHWGKTIVLGVYIILVYLTPLIFRLPPIAHLLSPQNVANIVPQDTDTFFRQYTEMVKVGDVQKAYSLLTDHAQATASFSALLNLSRTLASTTGQLNFVGYSVNYDEGPGGLGTVRDGVYELANNDQQNHYYNYVLIEIKTVDASSGPRVYGFHLRFNPNSANNIPLFDFSQGPALFLALAIPLFVIYTATRYLIRATKPNWWIFITIVLGIITLQHVGGSYRLSVTFGSFSMQGTGLDAATIIYLIPIPIGALAYYIYRKKVEANSQI